MSAPFAARREAALAVLMKGERADGKPFNRNCGSFLGQCCVDDSPLSEKQERFLDNLIRDAGLPPLANGE